MFSKCLNRGDDGQTQKGEMMTTRADMGPRARLFRVGSWEDWLTRGTDSFSSWFLVLLFYDNNEVSSSCPKELCDFLVPTCHFIPSSKTIVATSWLVIHFNSAIITQRPLSSVVHLKSSEHGISELAYHVLQSSRGLKLPPGYWSINGTLESNMQTHKLKSKYLRS